MRDTAGPNRNTNVSFRDSFTYFLIGGGIGAVIALLFAPKSGSELRGEIADVSRKGYDATREKAIELKEQSAEVIQGVREKADKVYDFAASKLKSGGVTVEDAVDTESIEISNGTDELQNDASNIGNKPANGRRASSIM